MKKRLIIIFIIFLLFPISNVFAITISYSTTFEDGYTYGDASLCDSSNNSFGYVGLKEVVDTKSSKVIKICLFSKGTGRVATCADSSMQEVAMSVNTSDGSIWNGYGCRKVSTGENGGAGTSNNNHTKPELQSVDCTLLGDPKIEKTPAYYLSFAFKVIRYVAIILLVVLSVVDFVTATASSDEDQIKKAFKNAITRLILCVLIFLLPYLIDFILNIIYENGIKNCLIK